LKDIREAFSEATTLCAARVLGASKPCNCRQSADDLIHLGPIGHGGEFLDAVLTEERPGMLLEKGHQFVAVRHALEAYRIIPN
jgi:hypothetical protein